MTSATRVGLLGVVIAGGLWGPSFAAAAGAKELEKNPQDVQPAGGGDAGREKAVALGRTLFAREWVLRDERSHGGDGLGPVYNERSCLACHRQGGPGGSAAADKNIDIITASGDGIAANGFFYAFGMSFGDAGFSYKFTSNPNTPRQPAPRLADLVQIHPGLGDAPSIVLHRFGPDFQYRSWRETIPGQHGTILVGLSQRNPTPLFGLGLIDAIPDDVIEAGARRRSAGSSQVRGRVSRLPDGRIGRFGWKAQTATLRDFILSAAASELGLEVPGFHQAADPRIPRLAAPGLDLTAMECDALTAYVASLPAPVSSVPAVPRAATHVKSGASLFKSIGCANCHVPKLGDVEGIYSDLLLHDMSPQLSDTGSYGLFTAEGPAEAARPAARRPAVNPRGHFGARVQEWRTPPLWGLRDSPPYMHDGRADTIDQAIALHGGQGASAAQRYAQLSARERQQLETFLLSLAAPRPADQPGP